MSTTIEANCKAALERLQAQIDRDATYIMGRIEHDFYDARVAAGTRFFIVESGAAIELLEIELDLEHASTEHRYKAYKALLDVIRIRRSTIKPQALHGLKEN